MTPPPDLAALARDFFKRRYRRKPGDATLMALVDEFKAVATQSRTAGRAEGLKEAATAADSCGETRAAQGRESNTEYHFAAAGALKALATHLRALASDPAPGDQAPGEELRRTITSAIATAIRDGDMKPGAAIGVAMSALAGCTEAVHGDNADIEMCRAYLRHRENTAAPAHPTERLARENVVAKARQAISDFPLEGGFALIPLRSALRTLDAALSTPSPAPKGETE